MKAARRLNQLQQTLVNYENVREDAQFTQQPTSSHAPFPKSDDDVVIVAAVRTPIGKAKRGAFKDTHPTDLLITVLQAIAQKIDPKLVQDIVVGNVLAPGRRMPSNFG